MKIVIFGANGRVGKLVVREALKRNHDITAVVHDAPEDMFGDGVRVIKADIHDRNQVSHAISGQDAVISTLGSWGTQSKDILYSGMKNIIPSMEHASISRIISLTGADARVPGDAPSLSSRIMESIFRVIAPKVFSDGEKHIRLLARSDVEWTVIRSPKMSNGKATDYALNDISANAWDTVSRQTIANAMLDVLEKNEQLKKAPIIHRKQ